MKGPRQVVEKRNPAKQRDTTKPYDPMEHPERQPREKRPSTSYRDYHEVRITRKIGLRREKEVAEYAEQHITEFRGKAEESPGIPHMLFERPADARAFANKLHSKLGVPKEHIEIKAHGSHT